MTPRRAALAFIVLLTLASLVAACGRSDGEESRGSLLIARLDGIYEVPVTGGELKPVITPEAQGSFVLDPAVSPDGQRLAYIVQPPAVVRDGRYDAGTDLWVAARDGSGARLVFQHVEPNQLVRFPQWEDDGRVLAIIQEIGVEDGVTTVTYTLQRIDVATGQRTRLLDDVLSFTLSPDGRRLAYARLSPRTGETFEAVNLDGSDRAVLVDVTENLAPFNSPRYAPDGARIAFASADQTGAALDLRLVSARPLRSAAPPLDGLPQDIWLVDASGGRPRRIADLKEDLPALTWSGDGKHIYVLGAAGLYDVNVETGATERIGEGAFHGQIAWAP